MISCILPISFRIDHTRCMASPSLPNSYRHPSPPHIDFLLCEVSTTCMTEYQFTIEACDCKIEAYDCIIGAYDFTIVSSDSKNTRGGTGGKYLCKDLMYSI